MAKITIKAGHSTIEAEMSISELIAYQKELAGQNGDGSFGSVAERNYRRTPQEQVPLKQDYREFFRNLTGQGKRFLHFVKAAGAQGVSAEAVAQNMGLKSRYEIGGITGGGLARKAKRFGVDLDEVYVKTNDSENGVKTVIFKPGKLLEYLE